MGKSIFTHRYRTFQIQTNHASIIGHNLAVFKYVYYLQITHVQYLCLKIFTRLSKLLESYRQCCFTSNRSDDERLHNPWPAMSGSLVGSTTACGTTGPRIEPGMCRFASAIWFINLPCWQADRPRVDNDHTNRRNKHHHNGWLKRLLEIVLSKWSALAVHAGRYLRWCTPYYV